MTFTGEVGRRLSTDLELGFTPSVPGIYEAHGIALALRFSPSSMFPPAGGYIPVRLSSSYPPNGLPPTPCVLVFPESGEFVTGNGKREGGEEWLVRFYFSQTGTLEKDYQALQAWLGVLTYQLRDSTQLGGLVDVALITGWRIALLPYGGNEYTGIELGVHIEAHESWLATA